MGGDVLTLTLNGCVVHFMSRMLYPWEKSLWYPLHRRLRGHHSCSVRVGEEKNLSLPGTTTIPCYPVSSIYTLRYCTYKNFLGIKGCKSSNNPTKSPTACNPHSCQECGSPNPSRLRVLSSCVLLFSYISCFSTTYVHSFSP
jgi:hypothetical protein